MQSFARLVLASAAALGFSALVPAAAFAKVHITVDLDKQTIHVEAKDQTYDWKVSSGKMGYETPNGKYNVLWMDKDHHSDEYDQAPMPNAIFFAPGYAIHGVYKSQWGRPASHGCVRLPVAKSAILFGLVKAQGADITITGYSPENAETIAAARKQKALQNANNAANVAPDNAAAALDPQDDGTPRAPVAQRNLFGFVY